MGFDKQNYVWATFVLHSPKKWGVSHPQQKKLLRSLVVRQRTLLYLFQTGKGGWVWVLRLLKMLAGLMWSLVCMQGNQAEMSLSLSISTPYHRRSFPFGKPSLFSLQMIWNVVSTALGIFSRKNELLWSNLQCCSLEFPDISAPLNSHGWVSSLCLRAERWSIFKTERHTRTHTNRWGSGGDVSTSST